MDIDFRNAFDLVDHKFLLKKMKLYGYSESSIAFLFLHVSYQSDPRDYILKNI